MSILQPAVKKETQKVVVYTVVGVVLMWGVLFLLRPTMPDKIVFDYTTILAGIIGGGVAILNFFLMGISVQNIAATEDQDLAKKKMKTSYSQRMALQLIWVVIAIAAPCFYFVAGILPLLFPSLGIKFMAVIKK
ncbi:hypothetical protein KGMB01110_18890 [Mediterraneibacter butyricigenes]|uniref:ATP synthase subunit I n=1 Tax=Mediterraneibacter butyricigenes TaxID=2316025 RepID=A0A391PCP5_9FIRM|nr:hypothetical protein [Mediterraneibacter butyricigenes]GCA67453.1 hypothetical protein KGMB01110_18890 [Mediterraneibacter butyricigenes]